MGNTNLRVVLSLDDETQSYNAVAHNLSVDQAVEHVQKLQSDGTTAAIVVQEHSHRLLRVERCRHCKQAATDFAERLNQAVAKQGQTEQELAPVAEGEGEEA